MADVSIGGGIDEAGSNKATSAYVWVTGQTGYLFYMAAGSGFGSHLIRYIKTVDGGATTPWTETDVFNAGFTTDLCDGVTVWYDRWTPGDTGQLIHICIWHESLIRQFGKYITLDTAGDTLATVENDIRSAGVVGTSAGRDVGMVKMEDGTLYTSFVTGTQHEVWVSTDAGVNWSALSAHPGSAQRLDRFAMFPTDSADNKDLMRLEWDTGTDEWLANIWDDSVPSWTQTTIGTAGDFIWDTAAGSSGPIATQWASTFDQANKQAIVVGHEDKVGVSHDLRVFTVHWDGTTLTITEKAKILTATSTLHSVCILIDNNTGDIIVHYTDGTDTSTVIQQVISTDGGSNWSSPVQISSEDTDYTSLWDAPQITDVGRTHPVFSKDGDPTTNGGTPFGQKGSSGGVVPALVAAGYI